MTEPSDVCEFCAHRGTLRITQKNNSFVVCHSCVPAALARKGVSADVVRFFMAWAPEISSDTFPGVADDWQLTGRPLRTRAEACPACGTTWETAAKSGLLGCPECYDAFNIVLPIPS